MAEVEEKKSVEGGDGDDEFVMVPKSPDTPKRGRLFIEGRLKDDNVDPAEMRAGLQQQLSSASFVVATGDDLLADVDSKWYDLCKAALEFLKVVEYTGPNQHDNYHSSSDVAVDVQIYQVCAEEESFEENPEIPQAEITYMPHMKFDRYWDELIFEEDHKRDLIWMISNLLRFSKQSGNNLRDINPILMLHGPPGTGKTTLCQGLAQKISIRLSSKYEHVKLIQIKSATLLSKYYSESAKIVDEIFNKIGQNCRQDSDTFHCILIDEVESIAFSRETNSQNGECQDSLRATNALLTGLDRMKGIVNVIFLCTSNTPESLDSAFLDRCGLKLFIGPPSTASQYAILCRRIQNLIDQRLIVSNQILPSYNVAVNTESAFNQDEPGNKILGIVRLIQEGNVRSSLETEISGRSLTQLPEQSILRYLREDECDLNMALGFMKRFVLAQSEQGLRRKPVEEQKESHATQLISGENVEGANDGVQRVEINNRKRKLKIIIEDYDKETLDSLKSFLAGFHSQIPKRSRLSVAHIKEEPRGHTEPAGEEGSQVTLGTADVVFKPQPPQNAHPEPRESAPFQH
ncbi:hypothetical protein G7Y89_g12025 [Cudoniella acicularis]|uniref:AAA+ ATPase domain-containing protein n=1 Tax=Cudoniella acicularis TaxID=354080 RepID=A0A8H4RDE1_9HELO|nr:hypothetical protein G7Y89_g12025 [Cudoniella acicularis]